MVGEGDVLCMLSHFYLDIGDIDTATAIANENVSLCKNMGMKSKQASALHHLASISLQDKEYDEAEQQILEAQRLSREVGAKGLEANLMLLLTQVLIGRMSQEDVSEKRDDLLPEAYVQARSGAFEAIKDALVLAVRTGIHF